MDVIFGRWLGVERTFHNFLQWSPEFTHPQKVSCLIVCVGTKSDPKKLPFHAIHWGVCFDDLLLGAEMSNHTGLPFAST